MKHVEIDRDMDAATMVSLKPLFDDLAAAEDDVRVDMSKVGFIDSSGIGGLVFLYKRLRSRSRSMVVSGISGQPQQLFLQLQLGFLIEPRARAA